MHMVIDIKRDASPQNCIESVVFFYTNANNIWCNNVGHCKMENPKTLTLAEMLSEYIKFQKML